jgi:hypothetical protein
VRAQNNDWEWAVPKSLGSALEKHAHGACICGCKIPILTNNLEWKLTASMGNVNQLFAEHTSRLSNVYYFHLNMWYQCFSCCQLTSQGISANLGIGDEAVMP